MSFCYGSCIKSGFVSHFFSKKCFFCCAVDGYSYRIQRKFSEDIDWSYAGEYHPDREYQNSFPQVNTKTSSLRVSAD